MAPVSSLHIFPSLPFYQQQQGNRRSCAILCCSKTNNDLHQAKHHPAGHVVVECGKRRRDLLIQVLSAAAAALPFPAFAAAAAGDLTEEGYRFYTDETNKYKIAIPQDWQVGSGSGNDVVRSLTAFYPQEASNTNISLVITGLGADFTRLESFGKVDAFAENLVSGIDRSWQRPPGVAAKLVDSRTANGMYYIEYTLKSPGESRRHLLSVLGVADNGVYNRLYTLTGQFVDEEEEKFGPIVQKAVSSFRLIK